jgi:hypothetical protein
LVEEMRINKKSQDGGLRMKNKILEEQRKAINGSIAQEYLVPWLNETPRTLVSAPKTPLEVPS